MQETTLIKQKQFLKNFINIKNRRLGNKKILQEVKRRRLGGKE